MMSLVLVGEIPTARESVVMLLLHLRPTRRRLRKPLDILSRATKSSQISYKLLVVPLVVDA